MTECSFNIDLKDSVAVVTIRGQINSLNAARFEQQLDSVLLKKRYHIILDMRQLEQMTSAGLRVILQTVKIAQSYGGKLVLAAVPASISELIDLTGFPFHIATDVETALKSLG